MALLGAATTTGWPTAPPSRTCARTPTSATGPGWQRTARRAGRRTQAVGTGETDHVVAPSALPMPRSGPSVIEVAARLEGSALLDKLPELVTGEVEQLAPAVVRSLCLASEDKLRRRHGCTLPRSPAGPHHRRHRRRAGCAARPGCGLVAEDAGSCRVRGRLHPVPSTTTQRRRCRLTSRSASNEKDVRRVYALAGKEQARSWWCRASA